MQLVAYGAQDIYLTGNPQITFFKVVYRRHTNFSMESIQQTLNGNPSAGSTSTVTISRNGDLVYKIYVCSADGSGADGTITNGSELVNEVELEIGGQKIDKLTAEWMQIWNELSTPESKAHALKAMQGDIGINGGDLTQNKAGVSKIQVPILFWFCRNPGLALPLIALQYHEVKLKCKWGTTAGGGVEEAQVWADYIYLDTDERRRFAQVSHEYLIEQIQIQSSSGTTSNKLNFNHPVKELIWTNQNGANYGTAQLKLNGHDRFAAQTYDYFQLRQPFDYHTAVPSYNVPLTLQGSLFSITGVGMVAATPPSSSRNIQLDADAGGGDGHVSIFLSDDGGTFHVDDVIKIANDTQNEEEIGKILTVTWDNTDTIYLITLHSDLGTVTDSVNDDVIIVTKLAGAVSSATENRTSKLDKKINVYSFALKPEEHQPSGTCNFSRIDNAKLDFTTDIGGTTGAVPNAASNIYAVNYNVLRIMSGMGGLAYSN